MRPTVVYFLVETSTGNIKIGKGTSGQNRLTTCQIGNSAELKLLLEVPGSFSLEKRLHTRFRHLRVRGEWFRGDPELLAFIEKQRLLGRKVPAPKGLPTAAPSLEEEPVDSLWGFVRPLPGGRNRPDRLSGRVFGRLTVLGLAGKDKRGSSLWRCRCECGNEKVVPRGRLRDGWVKSCGCLLREYKASPKPSLSQRPRPETDLTIITHSGNGRRTNALEVTCRIIRLDDDVEVTLVVPTWVSLGQYGIESSTLEALADGEYLAEWTYRLTREGTAYRTERAFSIEDSFVIDQSGG